MADKKLQMKEYNTSSADWDSILPVTNLAYVNGVSSSARTFLGTPSTHNLRQMVVDTGTGALVFAEYPVITASVLNSSTISDARYLSIIDTTGGVYSGRLRVISTSQALTGDVRLDVDLNDGNRILQLDGSLYVKTASVTLMGVSGGSEVVVPATGRLATLLGTETLANKTLSASTQVYSTLTLSNISSTTISGGTFVTPNLGVATAASINGVSLTSSGSSFTIGSGASPTVSIVRSGNGAVSFAGATTSLTLVNNGFLLASDAAPSANEGKVLQVVGGTPSWVSSTSITGSVDISSNLSAASVTSRGNLRVDGNATLTATFNGVILATLGVLSAGSASLANQVTGTLPVGRGGSGATTLTGVLVGNGVNAFTAVTAPSGTIVGTTDSQTLTNKSINLANNTLTTTFAQLNTAVSDATLLSESSTNTGITAKTFNDNGITFQDNGDTTRKMQFQLSAITPGTTASITIPDVTSGTMVLRNDTATLTNKTINLANNTLTTTFDQLNSAVSDATLMSINSTDTVTNKTFTDSSTTFQDNVDTTKKMQFQLSGLSASTTVTITVPNISGTLQVAGNTATLTNKTINGNNNTITNVDLTTGVTGTLPVANGGTGVTSKTGTGNVVLSANSVLTGTTTASTISATSLILANALPESEGGTGESTYISGQVLIGNSAGGLTKAFISGTTNEISVTTASGAITIGLPTTLVLPSATSIGNVSSTEIGYLDGVTSAVQTQLNQKLESSVITLFVADDSITTTTTKIPYGSRILWDADFYPGSRNAYFEVVIENSSASGVTSVDLQTTGGTHITTVTTSATSPTRVRSGAITLTDATQYEVELRTSNPGYTAYLYSARIIIAD